MKHWNNEDFGEPSAFQIVPPSMLTYSVFPHSTYKHQIQVEIDVDLQIKMKILYLPKALV